MKLGQRISGRTNNFDFLRFLAATAVIFSHSFPLTSGSNADEPLYRFTHGQSTIGDLSVDVFFIISGFLITQSYDRRKNVISFARSRILRIFPGLIFVVLLSIFVLGPTVTSLPVNVYFHNHQTYSYLKELILPTVQVKLPGVFPNNPFPAAVNGSLWSLRYEFIFYIVVGFLGAVRLLRKPIPASLFILALAVSIIHGGLYADLFRNFSAGMILYIFRDKIPMNKYLAFACIPVLLLSCITGGFTLAFAIFGAYLLVFIAVTPTIKTYGFGKHGDFSYGLYIFAFPIQQTITWLFKGNLNPFLNFVIAFPITLIFAFLSWHLVEKNALKFKSKSTGKKSSQNPSQAIAG